MKTKPHILPRVKAVKYLGGYKLALTFSNGRRGAADLGPYVRGKDAPLRSLRAGQLFRQVVVDPDFRTLTWPNGSDFDPDVLYWLVTGTPIAGATEARYQKTPPHLRKKKAAAASRMPRAA